MAHFGDDKIAELEAFVALVRNDPSILHRPELRFFKDYLVSLGAKVPEPLPTDESNDSESEAEFNVDTLNDDEVVGPEILPPPQLAPEGERELTDDDYDKLARAKEAATTALEEGDLTTAVECYTSALLVGNPTALLYTRRAEVLAKLKRYAAAIRDCNEALRLNPDNAKAYRIRGTANRYLGNWKHAHYDLDMGQKLDYDEGTWEMQKLVNEKFKKIDDIERSKQRKREEKEKKEREKRAREHRAKANRDYDEQKKRDAGGVPNFPGGDSGQYYGGMPGGIPGCMPGGAPGGFPGCVPGGVSGGFPGCMPGGVPGGFPGCMPGGAPGGMGGLAGLLGSINDPDIQKVFSNPKMMAAFQDIVSNPGSMSKYKDDPEIAAALAKLTGKFGGGMQGSRFPSQGGEE